MISKILLVLTIVLVGYCVMTHLNSYEYQGQPQDIDLTGTIFEK